MSRGAKTFESLTNGMGSTNTQDGREGLLTPLEELPVSDRANFFAASLRRA
jgi:hypothetical protein